jgi:ATP-dependent helicase/nuclease subunit A
VLHDPPDLFVERLRTLWLSEVTASARYLGRFRRARLERFFDRLCKALVEAGGSFAPVARFLRRAVEEAREPELPSRPDVSADAVHVMTIHSAKGLDFEHVYLLQTHAGDGRPIGTPAIEWRRGEGPPCYRLFGWPTPGFAAAEIARTRREREERVRLLYVAATRAKLRLVISGGRPAGGVLVPATEARSFAELVSHRGDPAALTDQAAAESHRRLEANGCVQWVLPVYAPEPAVGSSAGTQVRAVDVERVVADSSRLAALRAEAATRMTQPLVATVSGLVHRDLERHSGADHDLPLAFDRDLARLVGTEIHRVLESLDLTAELAEQLHEQRGRIERRLAATVPEDHRAAALARVAELFERIERGSCLARLASLADDIIARELPLLLPPEGERLAATVGTADLVYREGNGLVVADYKTDVVAGADAVAARVMSYRPQLELYAHALAEGLGLATPPRTELWFLFPDVIERL